MAQNSAKGLRDLDREFSLLEAESKAFGNSIEVVSGKKAILKQKIVELIAQGLKPEDAQVQQLRASYDALGREEDELGRKHPKNFGALRDLMQGPIAAAQLLANTIKGVGSAIFGATVGNSAKIENMEAAFTPLVGGAANAKAMIAALNKEAATTPYELGDIGAVAKQLLPAMGNDVAQVTKAFRMLGDTAGGDAQKLDSITRGYMKSILKGKVDMESLNMISEAGVPIYTELAKSMGVGVTEMMKLSSEGKITGDQLTKAFEDMTSAGGPFFDGMNVASKTFDGVSSTMSDNLKQAGAAIGSAFLPMAKETILTISDIAQGFTEWATTGTNLVDTLDTLKYVLLGATAGLAAFLLVTKGSAMLTGLATAFKVLTAAIATNPLAALAVVITAVLVPAIVWLVDNWEMVSDVFMTTLAQIGGSMQILGSQIKLGFVIAFNTVKLAVMEFAKVVFDYAIAPLQGLLKTLSAIPGVGEVFKGALAMVENLKSGVDAYMVEVRRSTAATILAGKEEQAAAEAALRERLRLIKSEADARAKARAEAGLPPEIVPSAGGGVTVPGPTIDLTYTEDSLADFRELSSQSIESLIDDYEKYGLERIDIEALTIEQITALNQYLAGKVGSVYGDLGQQISAHWRRTLTDLTKRSNDWSGTLAKINDALADGMASGLKAVGTALVQGDDGWRTYAATGVEAIGKVLEALGQQLAIQAAAALGLGQFGMAAALGAASAAAYVAAGAMGAVSSGMRSVSDSSAAAVAGVSGVAKALREIIDAPVAPLVSFASGDSEKRIKAIQDRIDALRENIDKFDDPLSNIFSLGQTGKLVKKWKEEIKDLKAEIARIQAEVANAAKEQAKAFEEAIDKSQGAISVYKFMLTDAAFAQNLFLANQAALAESQKDFWGGLFSAASEVSSSLSDALVSGLSEGDFLQSMKEYIRKSVVQAALFTTGIQDQIAQIGAAIAQTVAGGFDKAAVDDLRAQLKSLFDSAKLVSDEATKLLDDLAPAAGQSAAEIAKAAADEAKRVADASAQAIADIGSGISSTLVSSMVAGLGGDSKEKFLQAMKDLILRDMIQATVMSKEMQDKISSISKSISEGMAAGFDQEQMNALKGQLAAVHDAASAGAEVVSKLVKESFGQGLGTIAAATKSTSDLSESTNDLDKALIKVKKSSDSFFDSLDGIGSDITSSLIDSLVNGLTGDDFLYAIEEYITEAIIKASVYTDAFMGEVSAISAEIKKGLESGFTGGQLDDLKGRLAELHASAQAAADTATGIVQGAFASYKVGTLDVQGDQPAFLHDSEIVLSPGIAAEARSAGIYIGPPEGLAPGTAGQFSSPLSVNMVATGVMVVDGRTLGKVMFENFDTQVVGAYGL